MNHPIRRRAFLTLSASVGASAVIPVFAANPAAAAETADAAHSGQPLTASAGYTDGDANPLASSLTDIGETQSVALDNNYRSVGVDLGSVQQVSAVELIPETTGSRLNSRDLSVYTSDDNASWRKVPAEMVDLGSSLWLYGFEARARYVKVHCHRGELTGATFVINDIQAGLRVHNLVMGQFAGSGGGQWTYRTPIQVKNPTSALLRDRAVYISFAALGVDRLVAAGQLAGDLRDLRFTDAAGQELHAYTDGTGVFVRIPDIAPGATIPVFAYTGNPSAISRVSQDTGTLQVQYGNVTLTSQPAPPDAIKVVRLPSGVLMLVSSVLPPSGLTARFSSDGGRTWSDSEQILPPSDLPSVRITLPSGSILDPETGVLTFIYGVATVSSGSDWTDPAEHFLQTYAVQAASYTADGRPVFGEPQQIPMQILAAGIPAGYALTYTSPIRTRTGAYLLPISYTINPVGVFGLGFARSTDGGRTWVQSPTEITMTSPLNSLEGGVSENGLAQLSDGRIIVLARDEGPSRYYLGISESSDDGLTWTPLTDSSVFATDTQPTLISGRGEDVTLYFSGHNTFGQTSYYRNDLTAAYSDDNCQTWNAYHNLLAATSLSTPGWGSSAEARRVVNADDEPAGLTDRVFAWVDQGASAQAMLVEDFDAYLRDSHGALDVISYLDSAGAANGTELAQSRWWRAVQPGTLDLVPGSRPERQAVRLTTTPPGQTVASRQFPAIRQGTVRFALCWTSLGSNLRLSLQEAYTSSAMDLGTVSMLRLTPDGELIGLDPVIGILEHDTDPATGNLDFFGLSGEAALDYNYRSVGADMALPVEVSSLELVDDGQGNRVQSGDLKVWVSDTNASDWQELTDWTGVKNGQVITLSGTSVTTRYIKVSQSYGDTSYTFTNKLQSLLRFPGVTGALPVPTQLTQDDWHLIELGVDTPAQTVTVTVNGTARGTLPQRTTASAVGYLLVTLDASGDPSEIALDELIVQDTSRGLPAVAHIGPTTPA